MGKVCTKCREEKELTEFYKRLGGKDGLDSICKECKKELNAQYQRIHSKPKTEKQVGKEKDKPNVKTSTEQVCKSLKRFQIDAVKVHGNSIITKKHKKKDIIAAYKAQGLDVEVLDFETAIQWGNDTHYKVVRK